MRLPWKSWIAFLHQVSAKVWTKRFITDNLSSVVSWLLSIYGVVSLMIQTMMRMYLLLWINIRLNHLRYLVEQKGLSINSFSRSMGYLLAKIPKRNMGILPLILYCFRNGSLLWFRDRRHGHLLYWRLSLKVLLKSSS